MRVRKGKERGNIRDPRPRSRVDENVRRVRCDGNDTKAMAMATRARTMARASDGERWRA